MKLKELFPHLNLSKKQKKLEVKGMSEDSRLVKKKEIFFVRKKKNFDIFSVLKEAEKKAAAFVADLEDKEKLQSIIKKRPIIFVDNVDDEFYQSVDKFYGFNKDDFKFIGVTGTNGKTTTTHLIYHLLKKLKQNVSLIGTVKYYVGGHTFKATHTTPDYLFLRKVFKKIKGKKPRYVVIEASSHGIEQQRLKGINFSHCVFTNLSRDHLDYHKTMEQYFVAKRKLFLENKNAISLINFDDPYGKRILEVARMPILFGLSSSVPLRGINIIYNKEEMNFQLWYKKRIFNLSTSLLGRHNVLNILGALGVIFSLGFDPEEVVKLIPTFTKVEGRLEQVEKDIYVDYAHTPDALRRVLLTLREIGYGKIICVFGCGGDRDKGKRKVMGEVSGDYADFSFITSDNPRSEDPMEICRQISQGFMRKNYSLILNRIEAIKKAIKLKNKYLNCTLIVAGKGHEDYQIIGTKRLPFKDSRMIRKLIR